AGYAAGLAIGTLQVLIDGPADAVDLRAARGAERAAAGEAGDLEDDVDPLPDHGLRRGLSLVRSVEVLDIVDGDGDPCLRELHRVLVALDVIHDRWNVRPSANRTDLVRLGDIRGDDAREVPGLRLVEDEPLIVRRHRVGDELVDPEELDGGIRLRRRERVGPDEETDRHDDVVLLVDKALDVLLVVRDVLGDDVLGGAADRRGAGLNAFP